MNALAAIAPASLSGADPLALRLGIPAPAPVPPAASGGFGDILSAGLQRMEGKLANADDLVRRFALDDSVPVHQVTYALEEARLSVELAMQVRTRLVESYRELMNMQL